MPLYKALPTSPTFVAPALGTPASGVMTNVTGTAANLTAGLVTTNANLTGDVTSSGNATTIAAGKVHNTMLNTTAGDIGGAWLDYTPTLTNLSGGAITEAKYTQIGKTVIGKFRYVCAGAGVAGSVAITLPVQGATLSNFPIGNTLFKDANGAFSNGKLLSNGTTGTLFVDNAAGTYIVPTALSSTVPFTWADTDYLQCTFEYEVA